MLTKDENAAVLHKLQRDPSTAERQIIETLWSEHCSYKSSKRWFNLFNTESDRVQLGIGEGAGLVDVGDGYVIGLGLESHNHPSAIDPFNGAATGVGGIIRDIVSQGCKPVAVLDCLRFGNPTTPRQKLLLDQVVLGLSSYGNCVGVPNLGGDVEFAPEFTGNPLVNAMCVGVARSDQIIRSVAKEPGDLLLLFGAATGRDGLGGVTFASEDLSEEDQLESRGSVQIGDSLTEKLVIDAVLQLRDAGLLHGLQDLGGGGLACAAAEMAEKGKTGIFLELQKVPQKAVDMQGWEILVSESQERMLGIVAPDDLTAATRILDNLELAWAVVGKVTDTGVLESAYFEQFETRIAVDFVINGFPEPKRAIGIIPPAEPIIAQPVDSPVGIFLELFSSVNLSSRQPVFQQYDQHVQGNTVIPPGMDAGVIHLPNNKYLAIAAGTNSYQVSRHPYMGTILATLAQFRAVIARGAVPIGMVDSLNAGNPENPASYAEFVEIIKGVAEVSHKFATPIVGGNVSLYNESEQHGITRKILSSPFVGIAGLLDSLPIPDKLHATNSTLILLGLTHGFLEGSEYHRKFGGDGGEMRVDFPLELQLATFLQSNISAFRSVTDVGRGGMLITLAKWALQSSIGVTLTATDATPSFLFGEHGARYLLEVADVESFKALAGDLPFSVIGITTANPQFTALQTSWNLSELRSIWEQAMLEAFDV